MSDVHRYFWPQDFTQKTYAKLTMMFRSFENVTTVSLN